MERALACIGVGPPEADGSIPVAALFPPTVSDDWLTARGDVVQSADEVAVWIVGLGETHDIAGVGLDPWNSVALTMRLDDAGVTVCHVSQGRMMQAALGQALMRLDGCGLGGGWTEGQEMAALRALGAFCFVGDVPALDLTPETARAASVRLMVKAEPQVFTQAQEQRVRDIVGEVMTSAYIATRSHLQERSPL